MVIALTRPMATNFDIRDKGGGFGDGGGGGDDYGGSGFITCPEGCTCDRCIGFMICSDCRKYLTECECTFSEDEVVRNESGIQSLNPVESVSLSSQISGPVQKPSVKILSKNCPHGKQYIYCTECDGKAICMHNMQRYVCKLCGGKSICVHGRRKQICKECGGSAICIHGRSKYTCKDCGGSSRCIHNKIRNTCKMCKGSSTCLHGRMKSRCVKCKLESTFTDVSSQEKHSNVCSYCGLFVDEGRQCDCAQFLSGLIQEPVKKRQRSGLIQEPVKKRQRRPRCETCDRVACKCHSLMTVELEGIQGSGLEIPSDGHLSSLQQGSVNHDDLSQTGENVVNDPGCLDPILDKGGHVVEILFGKNDIICKACGKQKSKCQCCAHGRLSTCKICSPHTVCEHGHRKYGCSKCKGPAYCEHEILRARCKDCGGSEICIHKKIKYNCKTCSPHLVCAHDKLRRNCKYCGSFSKCEHGNFQIRCEICRPHLLCKHGILRSTCKGGCSVCVHKVLKSTCAKCQKVKTAPNTGLLCEHGKIPGDCEDCRARGDSGSNP